MRLLESPRGWPGILLILLLLTAFWALPAACDPGSAAGGPGPAAGGPGAGAGDQGSAAGDRRVIQGVQGFPLDYDSGNMALHALSSCLTATGSAGGYYALVGLSRSAFKFVYDTTEAYEPLRDLYPVDVLQLAARAQGHPDSHWETNRSINTVKSLIKLEIDSGRPVIAPFLKNDAYHGFFIITGYDYGKNIFYLQGALGLDSGYVSVPIPDYWDGPTASPAGWARNPVFLLGGTLNEPERKGADERKSVKMGIRLYRGGTLEYGTQPGEYEYMAAPGPHRAHYGLPAYEVLSADVGTEPVLVERGGAEAVNFGLLWRLDAQLGQLDHDRFHGATYMRGVSRYLRFDERMLLSEITENFERTVTDVRALRKMFFDIVPERLAGPEDVAGYVERENSIVYRIPDAEGLAPGLESLGLATYATPWGTVVVLDSPEKRLRAKVLVKSIASREKNSLYVMEDIVEHIGRPNPEALQPDSE